MWPIFWVIFPVRKRAALLIIVGEEILVVKHKIYFGSWNLPGGGVKMGEQPASSIVREVFEELHIAVNEKDIRELGNGFETIKEYGITSKQKFFACNLTDKPDIQQNHEILTHAWFTKNSTELGADTRRALELL